jgi:NADH dehydrogenase [ubiquinone] 1 alpha subcomplex assembly factor 5
MAGMDAGMRVFDRRAHRQRRDRAAALVAQAEPVLAEVADRLADRLDDTTRRFSRALDLGGRHGLMAERLRARGIPFVASADLSPAMARRAAARGLAAIAADEEALPFADGAFDLVVSNLSLHWVNDLPGALIQIRRALAPDGLFLATLWGLGTLAPVREAFLAAEAEVTGGASPRVSPFADLRDCAGLLQRAGFALPVADAETITVAYPDPFALFADLRALGETNAVAARSRTPLSRAVLARAVSRLASGARDGVIAIPFVVATLTGWAPHASQQTPLAPGSAAARLADALGAEEHQAGEAPLAPPAPPR